ncbi:MAG: hypothetical protein NZL96_00985 [Patescibacteria group bacterium]|nr:hypothetical protein [Patescibacteria group bacterium]
MLEKIITSRTRRKILELFFHHPEKTHYLREIVRQVGDEVNAVKRELDILSVEKLLLREKRLNKVYFFLNKHYLFYEEFFRIFAKTTFLSRLILENISKIGKIKYVALSMKFVKNIPIKNDEVHLVIVGVVVQVELDELIAQAEKTYNRSINYTYMTEEEFKFRKKNNDPFIWRFLKQPKVMLVGSDEEFMK